MKRLPKKLNVLGREYKVKAAFIDTDGICDPQLETIEINKNLNCYERALLHEAFHAAIFSAGLYDAIDNEKVIEIICEQLSRVVLENFEIHNRKS